MSSTVIGIFGNIIILAIFVLFNINNLYSPLWIIYWIITAAVFNFLLWGFFGVIILHRRCKNAFAQIDVQLKKRNDLVPNLVNIVKGYMKHERKIMDNISKARKEIMQAKSPSAAAKASDLLSDALKSLFAIAENYPNLKASENFKLLQEQLEGIEDKIAYSRQFYNDSVMDYDTKLSSSHLIFAKILGYKRNEFPYFGASEKERKTPKIKF